jgi:predicted Fe-Mo cluster-binding NifX family protein
MRIAIPLTTSATALHAGHARRFLLLSVDPATGAILEQEEHPTPDLPPGGFPAWLATLGVGVLLAGGLGPAAHRGCEALGIQVVTGLDTTCPAKVVAAFLQAADRPSEHT